MAQLAHLAHGGIYRRTRPCKRTRASTWMPTARGRSFAPQSLSPNAQDGTTGSPWANRSPNPLRRRAGAGRAAERDAPFGTDVRAERAPNTRPGLPMTGNVIGVHVDTGRRRPGAGKMALYRGKVSPSHNVGRFSVRLLSEPVALF